MHNLQYTAETATDAVFTCTACNKVIGFNKAGIGEPHAEPINGTWVPPMDADDYLGECV